MVSTSTVRKFVRDVGWVLISQIIILLTGFLLRIVLARFLGTDDLGLYTMSFTIYFFAALVAGMGIPAATTRFVAQYKDDDERLGSLTSSALVNSTIFAVVISFILFLLSSVLADLFDMPELSSLIKIIAIALPFRVLGDVILLGLLTGLREMKLYGIAMACRSILLFGLATLFVAIDWGVREVVLAIVLADAGTLILSFFFARKHLSFGLQDYSQTTRTLIPFGARLFLAGMVFAINTRADMLLVGYFLFAKDVGVYAIAIAIATVLQLIPQVISTVTYPMMSEYSSKQMHPASELLVGKTMKYTLVMLSVLGIFLILFSRDIILRLLGSEFLPAVVPLAILIFGLVFFGSMASVGSAFSAAGRPDIPFRNNLIVLVVNLGLDIVLIPWVGIKGAAIGTAVSLSVLTVLSIYLLDRVLKIRIDIHHYAKVLIPTAAMIAIFFVFEDRVNSHVLSGALFTIHLILATMFFLKKEDRENLREILTSGIRAKT